MLLLKISNSWTNRGLNSSRRKAVPRAASAYGCSFKTLEVSFEIKSITHGMIFNFNSVQMQPEQQKKLSSARAPFWAQKWQHLCLTRSIQSRWHKNTKKEVFINIKRLPLCFFWTRLYFGTFLKGFKISLL